MGTLEHQDSFDHYATAQAGTKWSSASGSVVASIGRVGTSAWRCQTNEGLLKTIPVARQDLACGFAFKSVSTIPNPSVVVAAFRDGGTNQFELRITNTGRLFVTRNGTQVGVNGATVLVPDIFYYIEFKVHIDNSAGSYEVRISELTEISGSSVDTQNTANASADQLLLSASTFSGTQFVFDDVYLIHSDGSGTFGDFLGDIGIEATFPDGNGNLSQWDGSDGNATDNYLLKDEATPNDDTDYITSGDAGDIDLSTHTNLVSTSGTVLAVVSMMRVRKDDAGARTIAAMIRSGGNNYAGTTLSVQDSYNYLRDVHEVNPDTSNPWSFSEVDAAEFGIKVVS